MMSDSAAVVTDILSGGGVLAFAAVVWRAQQRMSNTLDKMLERLVRIDDRTFRAEVDGIPMHIDERPTRGHRLRKNTPVARPRTQTGLMNDDNEEG
jgi:hypothetical protein